MNSPSAEWRVVGNPVVIAGYAHGCRYPSMILNIAGHVLTDEQRKGLSDLLRAWIPLDDPQDPAFVEITIEDPWHASIVWLLAAVRHLQCAARLGVVERGRILAVGKGTATCSVPIAARAGKLIRPAVDALMEFMQRFVAGENLTAPPHSLTNAQRSLADLRPTKTNVPRFMRAAFELGLHFQELPGDLMQYGLGRRARWMDSSLTDETPHISTVIVRDKPRAARMLQRAGLPTPPHYLVASEEAALEAATQLGYPVVVKPANLDGGIGVTTDLQSPAEVRAAFRQASEYSPHILVEKHIAGRDYRLVVLHDEVIAAIERIPAGVFGDGQHTVQALIDRANADPRRREGPHALLKRLHLDDEAHALLERAGLQPSSVPRNGDFVRLRRAANIASGGMPVPVLEKVHPDNLRLAVRAAKALRLDFAGIDLLMNDVTQSWKECGAAICEVNAQPNMGRITTAHLYAPILQKLVPGNGRIPIVIVLGASPQSDLARRLASALQDRGYSTGCHDAHGVRIGDEEIMLGRISTWSAGTALAAERTLAAMVVTINDFSTLRTGLPFARYDLLVLAGSHIEGYGEPAGPGGQMVIELFTSILPACDGRVITVEGSGVDMRALRRTTRARWDDDTISPNKLVVEVLAEMIACEAKHGAAI